MKILATCNLLIYLATAIAPAGSCYLCLCVSSTEASASAGVNAPAQAQVSCCAGCASSSASTKSGERDGDAITTSTSSCDCSTTSRACCIPDDPCTKTDTNSRDGAKTPLAAEFVAAIDALTLAPLTLMPTERERPPTGPPRFEFQILRL